MRKKRGCLVVLKSHQHFVDWMHSRYNDDAQCKSKSVSYLIKLDALNVINLLG